MREYLRKLLLFLVVISSQFSGKQTAPTIHMKLSTPEVLNNMEDHTEEFVKNYLVKFGYTSEDNMNDGETEAKIKEGIKRFQAFAGLPQTGDLDEMTLKLMKSPRCQVLNVNDGKGEWKDRRKRFLASAKRWATSHLTYKLMNYPRSQELQDRKIVDQLVENAINDWREVTPLTISKAASEPSNIKIRFVSRDHGDGFPFDGRGFFVGHTFLPESGEVHLDDDELWVSSNEYQGDGSQSPINLRQLLTHELGHALGLDHSSLPQAVMYALYYYRSNFTLHPDDISGIESIYGKKTMVSTNPVVVKRTTPAYLLRIPRISTKINYPQVTTFPSTKKPTDIGSFWDTFFKWLNLS